MIEGAIGGAVLQKGLGVLASKLEKFDIGKRIESHADTLAALKNFSDKYIEQYGSVKVLGMSRSIPISDIYTGVNISDSRYHYMFSNPEQLERSYIESGLRGIPVNESKLDAISVADNAKKLNILGAPGAGKTTFLKRLGLEALSSSGDTNYTHSLLPVFIELKTIRTDEPDIELLVSRYLSEFGFPFDTKFINDMLKRGAFLFLFDGLDEAETKFLKPITESVRSFTRRYGENRFVTSCRTAFYSNQFSSFQDVYLLDFDEAQIEHFSRNWFVAIEKESAFDGFLKQLSDPRFSAAYELARTPLLLTFLCIVYSKTLSFPVNRASLYKKALETLLHDWLAEKDVQIFDAFDGLHIDLEVLMLSSIAGPFYSNNKLFFTIDEITERVRQFLVEELNAPKNLDARKIVKVIEQKQGVLTERSQDVYSFSHLTLHEYLAAVYYKEYDNIESLINAHAKQDRWREVFLLLSGMGTANSLVSSLSRKCDEVTRSSKKFHYVCTWLRRSEKAGSTVDSSILVRRMINFSRFVQSNWVNSGKRKAYIDELSEKLTNTTQTIIDITIDHELEEEIKQPARSSEKRRVAREFSSQGLPKQYLLHEWGNAELIAAIDYFSIYNLIVECKKSSLSISKTVWDDVVSNFLSGGDIDATPK